MELGGKYDFEAIWFHKNGLKSQYIEFIQTKPRTKFPERNYAEAQRKDKARVAKRVQKAANQIEQIALQVAIGLRELHQSYCFKIYQSFLTYISNRDFN